MECAEHIALVLGENPKEIGLHCHSSNVSGQILGATGHGPNGVRTVEISEHHFKSLDGVYDARTALQTNGLALNGLSMIAAEYSPSAFSDISPVLENPPEGLLNHIIGPEQQAANAEVESNCLSSSACDGNQCGDCGTGEVLLINEDSLESEVSIHLRLSSSSSAPVHHSSADSPVDSESTYSFRAIQSLGDKRTDDSTNSSLFSAYSTEKPFSPSAESIPSGNDTGDMTLSSSVACEPPFDLLSSSKFSIRTSPISEPDCTDTTVIGPDVYDNLPELQDAHNAVDAKDLDQSVSKPATDISGPPVESLRRDNTDGGIRSPQSARKSFSGRFSRPLKCRKTGQKQLSLLDSTPLIGPVSSCPVSHSVSTSNSPSANSAIEKSECSKSCDKDHHAVGGKETFPALETIVAKVEEAEVQSASVGSPIRKAPKAKKSCHPADEPGRSPCKSPPVLSPVLTPVSKPAPPTPIQPSSGFGTVLLTELGRDLGIEGQSIDKLDGRTIDQMILAKLREHLRPRNGCIGSTERERIISPNRLSPRTPSGPSMGRCRKRARSSFVVSDSIRAFSAAGINMDSLKSPSVANNRMNFIVPTTRDRSSFSPTKSDECSTSPRLRSASAIRDKSSANSTHVKSSAARSPARSLPMERSSRPLSDAHRQALDGFRKRRRLKASTWARGTIPKTSVARKKTAGQDASSSATESAAEGASCLSQEELDSDDTSCYQSDLKRRRVGSLPLMTALPTVRFARQLHGQTKGEFKCTVQLDGEFLVTPPATPLEELVNETGRLRLLGTNRELVSLCHCKMPPLSTPLLNIITSCQAIDSIDGKTTECLAKVTENLWARPSTKTPLVTVCEYHRQLLRKHQCCPTCGVFCTQGSFMQCRQPTDDGCVAAHYFHEGCQVFLNNKNHCPHCGIETSLYDVLLRPTGSRPVACISVEDILKQSILKQSASTDLPAGELAPLAESTQRARISAHRKLGRTKPPGSVVSATDSVTSSNASHSTQSADRSSVCFDRRDLETAMSLLDRDKLKKTRISVRGLISACRLGDVEKVLYILSEGINPCQNSDDLQSSTALHAAAKAGHHQIVVFLLQAGAQPNVCDHDLRTPLLEAVEHGHMIIIETLLKAGSLSTEKTRDGMSLLHVAAKSGQMAAIRLLLENRKLNVNAKDDGGWTPIVWAAEHRNIDCVQYLLCKGADAGIRDNEYNTGLHWAAFAGSCQIAEIFLDAGCNIDSPNEHGDRPIHIAARQEHMECVNLFLLRGANIDVINLANENPLMCCVDPDGNIALALKIVRQLRPTRRRAERLVERDISRGREPNPVTAVNVVDDSDFPKDFLYVSDYVETMPVAINRIITAVQSCKCQDNCSAWGCECSAQSIKCWYDQDGRLSSDFNYADPPLLFECNRACQCYTPCNNRVVQLGIVCRLQVFKTDGRGWGVRTLVDIPRGTFVCEYAGELITDEEADKREDDSYLFDLDNQESDTFCIDAAHYGNVSRFINHLCEPNLVPVKVFVDHQDLRFPRMCFFAVRDVNAYEELGFDYGSKFWIIKWKQFTCTCMSPKCRYSKDTIAATIAEYNRRQQDDEGHEAVRTDG